MKTCKNDKAVFMSLFQSVKVFEMFIIVEAARIKESAAPFSFKPNKLN